VVLSADLSSLIKDDGYQPLQRLVAMFSALGYEPAYWHLRGTGYGGVIHQDHLMVLLEK
jgi:hypothetical protein